MIDMKKVLASILVISGSSATSSICAAKNWISFTSTAYDYTTYALEEFASPALD